MDFAPAHTSMQVREFWAKNKTVIVVQPPYSPDLTKPEDTDERKDKRKIEKTAVGDTKKRFSEMFRGLEKTLP